MKLIVGLVFCVALATGSVIDEFQSFKTRFNKVYKDEAEVRKEKIPIRNASRDLLLTKCHFTFHLIAVMFFIIGRSSNDHLQR